MGEQAILALLGVLVAVGAAVGAFAYGRAAGRTAGRVEGRTEEVERQRVARATAEETAKRILGDAEREAEAARKSAVVTGKEELLKLRETQEAEVRGRREEVADHDLQVLMGSSDVRVAVEQRREFAAVVLALDERVGPEHGFEPFANGAGRIP